MASSHPNNGKTELSGMLRNSPGAHPVHSPHVTAASPYSGKMSDAWASARQSGISLLAY